MKASGGCAMERTIKRLHWSIGMTVVTTFIASISLCFADILPSKDPEIMAAFSNSLDTELGGNMKALFEENDLEIDLKNSLATPVPGGEMILVPLTFTDMHQMETVKDYHQKSQFLAYIDQVGLGRFLVLLEVMNDQAGEITAFKMVYPSGRGLMFHINPFCIYPIADSQTGISLQENDDLENSIIISDTCDTLRIIIIVLTAGCLISLNPIPCAIATVMETIYQLIC